MPTLLLNAKFHVNPYLGIHSFGLHIRHSTTSAFLKYRLFICVLYVIGYFSIRFQV